MAFENISKGEFHSNYKNVNDKYGNEKIVCYGPDGKKNSEFIAYCFNLQQRYDISKLEEAVDLLSKIAVKLPYGFEIKQDSDIHKQIEQLLKEIKK